VPQAELDSLHRAGYFLDLWHWRAARSNPFGTSDDEYILAYRQGDAGKAPFTSNWDGAKNQPLFMLDRNKVGRAALSWDDITNGKLGFDDVYYISENNAVPFDASYAWKDGDTIPRLLLQQPTGSHGNIKPFGKAQWRDGYWDVTLQRAMDTGSPADDKIFADKGSYTIAVAVHRDAAEGRWHYVSMPFSLGLGRDAEIAAAKFTGSAPEWKQPWTEVTLFYPGQVSWPHLNSAQHAGAKDIKKGVPVKYRHSEEQLAYYGVEREFANEIRWQWLLTMIAGLVLIGAFGFALTGLLVRRGG
jgi:hypothetical protein